MVSLSHQQGLLLVANRSRSSFRSGQFEAEGPKSQASPHSGTVCLSAGKRRNITFPSDRVSTISFSSLTRRDIFWSLSFRGGCVAKRWKGRKVGSPNVSTAPMDWGQSFLPWSMPTKLWPAWDIPLIIPIGRRRKRRCGNSWSPGRVRLLSALCFPGLGYGPLLSGPAGRGE